LPLIEEERFAPTLSWPRKTTITRKHRKLIQQKKILQLQRRVLQQRRVPQKNGAGEKGPEGDKKKEEKKDIFAEIMGEEAADAVKIHKAKSSKNVTKGIVHISATFNNTMVTITDATGNTIGWSSAGKMGFKGSRKSTAYAAQVVSQDACRQAMGHGLKEAEVRVKGPGAGRESAVRAVQAIGIDVSAINDVTPIPHNGCRPKKARRV
jgi:small subunit ribosomal protein S11